MAAKKKTTKTLATKESYKSALRSFSRFLVKTDLMREDAFFGANG